MERATEDFTLVLGPGVRSFLNMVRRGWGFLVEERL